MVLLSWDNKINIPNLYKIHGSKDKLLPEKNSYKIIQNGGHLIIVDKAIELSKVLNRLVT